MLLLVSEKQPILLSITVPPTDTHPNNLLVPTKITLTNHTQENCHWPRSICSAIQDVESLTQINTPSPNVITLDKQICRQVVVPTRKFDEIISNSSYTYQHDLSHKKI